MSEAESRRIFQTRFNDLLAQRGVSQKEVARICGASPSTVSTWSKGLNMPRMDKLERLADYFGLPRSYFIEESPTPLPPTDAELKFALFGGGEEITDAMFEEVKNFAAYVRQREAEKKRKE